MPVRFVRSLGRKKSKVGDMRVVMFTDPVGEDRETELLHDPAEFANPTSPTKFDPRISTPRFLRQHRPETQVPQEAQNQDARTKKQNTYKHLGKNEAHLKVVNRFCRERSPTESDTESKFQKTQRDSIWKEGSGRNPKSEDIDPTRREYSENGAQHVNNQKKQRDRGNPYDQDCRQSTTARRLEFRRRDPHNHHTTTGSQEAMNTTSATTDIQHDREVQLFEKGSVELCEFAQTEWIPLPKPLVVDSGAGETVIPNDWLPQHPMRESMGSKSEDYYTTADGTKVYNEGEKKVDVCTLDGRHKRSMTFQVARVKKALGSVSQMVQNNNRVVFDQDEQGRDVSYVQNKRTQEKLWLRKENGVYVLDLLVGPPKGGSSDNRHSFGRPGP